MPTYIPTDEQLNIISHNPDENARILAGPGTGKSCTIIALINSLLERSPGLNIKLLTFTRAASGELANRVSTHSASITLSPSTIHSFAISVLLRNSGAGNILEPLRIADDWETAEIINPTLAKRAKVSKHTLNRLLLEMASNWESLRPGENPRISLSDRTNFLGAWNEHRRIYGYTLLGEIPYALRTALRDHPDLEGIDLDLLFVDEYQDLNACDLHVLKLIEQRECSIIAVGDDDQSIYSFRNAAPDGIRRFLIDYPGARDYPLSVTQRCGRKIIDWAQYVIEGDPDRPRNRARPTCAANSPEGDVALLSFKGHIAEAKGIARLTQILIERKAILPSEILILLRGDHNGSFSGPIKSELDKLGIRYSDPNIVDRILSEPGNRHSIGIFRLLVDKDDSIAWATVLNLRHGIGEKFFNSIYKSACENRTRFSIALLQAYESNFIDIPAAQSRLSRTLIRLILEWIASHPLPEEQGTSWGRWIIETLQDETLSVLSDEFKLLLLELDRFIEPNQSLDRFLGQITPLSKDIALTHNDGVRIMTMGKAKGLTVRATIIGAVEEGLVPRPDCTLGEERRLLYVAMTRSKEFLYCTWARRRKGPTARSGIPRVGLIRNHCTFLNNGPVESQDGLGFIDRYI